MDILEGNVTSLDGLANLRVSCQTADTPTARQGTSSIALTDEGVAAIDSLTFEIDEKTYKVTAFDRNAEANRIDVGNDDPVKINLLNAIC